MLLLAQCRSRRSEFSYVFRYNEASGISSLDPASASWRANIWAVNHLFNGLLQLDDDLKILPSIAKDWDISSDGLTYTFQLRNDVFFHQDELFGAEGTRRVNAEDFVYSLSRIIDPAVASPGNWVLREWVSTDEPFKALDDTTFQIKLKTPYYPFLNHLTMQYCFVVPREVVEKYGRDFRAHPVGTGPFVFQYWEEDSKLTLTRNNNYFEELGEHPNFIQAI